MRTLLIVFCLLLFSASTPAVTREVATWTVDETRFSGYLLYPQSERSLPGLLMVPNWRGINESALSKAEEIAARGYVVLLADVYGETVRPTSLGEASAAAQDAFSDRERLRKRAAAALQQLREAPEQVPLQRDHLAAIGFCFGGGTVLELARSGAELAAVVSFHGSLNTSLPASVGAVSAKLLVLNGADDRNVSAESITNFQNEMNSAGADWQFVNFSGAVHCFAEKDAASPPGCLYHPRSAQRAFRMMDAHLQEAFSGSE